MGILRSLEMEHDIDDVDKFLQYFRTMCDSFEPLIIKLTSDSEKYKEAINEIERLAHNTAWAARRLDLGEITDFCVFCEEMMQEASRFNGPASDEFADWLLLMSDQFEKYCRSYENDASVLALFNPLIVNVPNIISK
ncbi:MULTISPECIES: histidine phosphotransferase [unclassified Campylobacter]|uniref:histidine phosphotransferase n=1 Tax=unclassified Campylobacter TaxID=2593542 RepID=UPI001238324A|nr:MULTISPECIES: histidine phosphotransferase [unclassified Campylobacter]KAA6224777.1 histidine phosphotransferase [Campylobacter sp. LR185c]KAA6227352.1 histidine phosphotransferase [Campylobacter sp. LR196d]KAA6228729.1 histidine phosphotransferase [Campylobacter sp. LR286c]KAA6229539.1 histidine phosphotransferase [Campylobacter sp. LR264d]KAA6230783.1 histidine phosphotransferase [Campylobacter sp. LR291e]